MANQKTEEYLNPQTIKVGLTQELGERSVKLGQIVGRAAMVANLIFHCRIEAIACRCGLQATNKHYMSARGKEDLAFQRIFF